MDIRILGSLQVRRDGESVAIGGRRQRMVLAMLVQRSNRSVSASELIDAVWGPDPPASARKTVQVYISRLRHLLGPERIEHQDGAYVFKVSPLEVDAQRFERLAEAGHDLLGTEPGQAVAVLGDALALWRGSPWGDLGDQPALEADVAKLGQLRMSVVEDRLAGEIALGLSARIVGELESLVDSHPYRERLRELLMLALYRSGQQARALEVYEEARTQLAAELGADPGWRLADLHARILRQDPSLQVDTPTVDAPSGMAEVRNPYKGLRPFEETDARDFFGRDDLVDEILSALVTEALVTVIGPSGCGKSSVVRAGVIPALRAGALPNSESWAVAVMVPGPHPFAELETVLARTDPDAADDLAPLFRGNDLDLLRAVLHVRTHPSTRVLLVIDQFEELFLAVEDDDRERFVANLVEAAEDPHSGLSILLTLRADMVDRPLAHARLGRLVAGGQVPVLPLEPANLEEACVAPAAGVGVTMEPELAAELVADAAHRPGALPLLQFALTELFDRRRGAVLTVADLEDMGGIDGVVARRAEATFEQLDDEARSTARQVFLRLVAVGDDGPDSRQRVHRDDLGSAGDADAVATVLEHFGAARLLTFDRDPVADAPTVMLPHDALLRAWPRFRTWIDESRADLRRRRTLGTAAAEWLDAGRDDDYLLPGGRAEDAEAWLRRCSVAIGPKVRDFVAASARRQREHEAARTARVERERQLQRRAVRRLRALVVVLVVAVIGTAGLTAVVADRGRQARAAEAEALVQSNLNRARELTSAAVAIRNRDPDASLLLSLYAVDIMHLAGRPIPTDTVAALHWGLQAARVQYPVAGLDGVVLDGPEGPRGIFPMPLPDLVRLARDSVDRQLTTAECVDLLGLPECPELTPDLAAVLPDEPTLAAEPDTEGPPLAGTEVRVLTPGDSQASWARDLERLEEVTGVTLVVDEESFIFESLVKPRIGSGRVDLVVLPQPAALAELARNGDLMVLGDWMDPAVLRDELSNHLVTLGSVAADGTWPAEDGQVFGVPHNIDLKSLVWYPVRAFREAGYDVPESQAALDDLVARIEADGGTPWCHGEGADAARGWPGTDWIEDLLLVDAGPEYYDEWVAHEVPFDDEPVRAAFRRYGELVLAPGRVAGGQGVASSVPPWEAIQGMLKDPPGCWLMHQASFAQLWLPAGVVAGEDVAAFPFPPAAGDGRDTVLGAGGYLVAVTDRPEVREVLRYLVGPEWWRETIAAGTWRFPANRHFPLDTYPEPTARLVAATLQEALASDSFRFDGSDLMPTGVQTAFWGAMATWTATAPDGLDDVLAEVEDAWANPEAGFLSSGSDDDGGG